MLDYILSKTVMLLFLLLTVAAFAMVKDSLADYFIQQSAVQFARTSVTRISAIVGDSTAMAYTEVIPLAPGISGGGKQMAYDVNVLCKRKNDKTVLIGFAVLNPVGKVVGFSATELYNPMGPLKLVICHRPGSDKEVVASSTKDHYIIIKKDSANGTITVTISPSKDGMTPECASQVDC